jgi:hypothetical protein
MLDTLEILIEADASGLTSQLKDAGNKITQFVDNMNHQEVSWTEILAKDVSPALIASIAATVATSITQALQLQTAVQAAQQTTNPEAGQTAADMTAQSIALSEQTGQSAQDIANAMAIVNQTFKNTADSQAILNTVTDESYIKGTSVVSMAQQLVPLFQEWGVTGAQSAQVMADINAAVASGEIPFNTLIDNLTQVGPALSKVSNLQDVASGAELASATPGMDAASALQGVQTMAQAVQNPLSQAGVLLGGIVNKIKTGGIGAGFADIASHIQSAGSAAQALYGNIGLDANSITHFQNTSTPALLAIDQQILELIKNAGTLPDQMKKSETATKDLMAAWNTFVDILLTNEAPPLLKVLTDGLSGISNATKAYDNLLNDPASFVKVLGNQDFWNALGDNFHTIGKDMLDIITIGADNPIKNWANSTVNSISGGLKALIDTKGAALENPGVGLTPNLVSNTGAANSSGNNITVNVNVEASSSPLATGMQIGQGIKTAISR